jgi:hypothetical protein
MTRGDTPVDCFGFTVYTERFDSLGNIRSAQHGSIKRRYADAQAMLGKYPKALPGETVRQTIQTVKTCFPLSDVHAGNAMRWTERAACEGFGTELAA